MGNVIKKKLNRMSWFIKTSLVLLLTLATTLVMYEGWYSPKAAKAATVTRTYYVIGDTTTPLGIDGTANLSTTTTSDTNNATSASVPPMRGLLSTSVTGATATSYRPGSVSTGTMSLLKAYSPAYAVDTDITAIGTANMALRSAATTYTWKMSIYDYNPASTTAQNKVIIATSSSASNATAATTQSVVPTYTFPGTYRILAGHRLMVEFTHTATAASTGERIYYGGSTTTAGSWIKVDETDVITDSTPPVAGTVTVSPDISSTYTSAAPTITTIFTDAESAVTSCQYATNGVTYVAGVVSGTGPYTCTGSPTGLTGLLNINMKATSGGGIITATPIQRTVDLTVPTDGVLTVTRGDSSNSLSWTAATDPSGSGIASYILKYATGATAPLCSAGIAVPGSPFSAATLSTVHTGLTNLTQYSYRLCAVDNIGNTTAGATGTGTPSTDPSKIANCTGCHFNPLAGGVADGTGRNTPPGQFQGSHSGHVTTATMACASCHTVPATTTNADFNHANGTVNMAAAIAGGTYIKGSAAVSNTFAPQTCNNTTCHGSTSPSPTWGNNTTYAGCTKCHGVSTTSPAQYTTDPKNAAPGYVSTAPAGTGRDVAGLTAATGTHVGAHDTHLKASNGISSAIACTECHSNVSTTSNTFTGHMDGTGTLSFGTLATKGTGTTPSYNATTGTCSSTYCHFGRSTAAPATTTANVVWNNTAYLTGVDTAAADCGKCHASPPETTVNHTAIMTIADCNGCHDHVNTSGVFTNAALHINGIVENQASCVTCHAKVQGTRSIITGATGEFGLAWGHKNSTRTAVTDSDCIVCHLEGTWATQKANNYNVTTNPTGRHKNGVIDLRDPDGAGETVIKNISGTDFTFAKFAVSFAAGSRTSTGQTSNTDVANVVTQKFCMACHDSNGAINPTALTRDATNTTTTGTQYMPFEGKTMAAGYTTFAGAAVAGGLVDVKTQFATANSSAHPVIGPRNRAYPVTTALAAPYNGFTRTGGTKSNGVVLNCFDCHSETVTIASRITTRTITSHGNALTIPGTLYGATGVIGPASPTFCLSCHLAASYTTGAQGHNTGTGMSASKTDMSGRMTICGNCHFSSPGKPARPLQAADVHGFNGLAATGTAWTAGGGSGMRPIAFMRNTVRWATGSPRPASATGITAGTATCAGLTQSPTPGTSCGNSMGTYTPSGAY